MKRFFRWIFRPIDWVIDEVTLRRHGFKKQVLLDQVRWCRCADKVVHICTRRQALLVIRGVGPQLEPARASRGRGSWECPTCRASVLSRRCVVVQYQKAKMVHCPTCASTAPSEDWRRAL